MRILAALLIALPNVLCAETLPPLLCTFAAESGTVGGRWWKGGGEYTWNRVAAAGSSALVLADGTPSAIALTCQGTLCGAPGVLTAAQFPNRAKDFPQGMTTGSENGYVLNQDGGGCAFTLSGLDPRATYTLSVLAGRGNAWRNVASVYAVEGDDAEAAAQTIADGYIKHISGRKSDGHIAMVKADNGWFYAAVVTTTTGGSGSGSGSGSDDGNGGGTTDPTDPDTGDGEEDDPVVTEKYTITVTCGENGNVMHNGKSVSGKVEIEVGTSGTFTFDPDDTYEIDTVTVDSKKVENPGTSYTFDDDEDHTINVTFKKCAIIGLTVETIEGTFKDVYWVGDNAQTGEKFDPAGLKVSATYSDYNKEDVTDDCTFTIDNKKDYIFTSEDAAIGSKQVVIKHPASGKTTTVTVTVRQVRMVIDTNNVTRGDDGKFSPVGMMIKTWYYENGNYTAGPSIKITQDMINSGEVIHKYEGREFGIWGKYKYRIYYRSLNAPVSVD